MVNIQEYDYEHSKLKVDNKWLNVWRVSCREVFKIRRNDKYYVIKIATKGERRQQEQEIYTYSQLPRHYKKYFAKIVDYGMIPRTCGGEVGYILQEYVAKGRNQSLSNSHERILSNINNKYGFTDLYGRTASDHIGDNDDLYNVLVDKDNNLKIIDWGV